MGTVAQRIALPVAIFTVVASAAQAATSLQLTPDQVQGLAYSGNAPTLSLSTEQMQALGTPGNTPVASPTGISITSAQVDRLAAPGDSSLGQARIQLASSQIEQLAQPVASEPVFTSNDSSDFHWNDAAIGAAFVAALALLGAAAALIVRRRDLVHAHR